MTASIPLHAPTPPLTKSTPPNPLPQLLRTPSGLAILEMQGSINLSPREDTSSGEVGQNQPGTAYETPIGRLVFPEYKHDDGAGEGKWMKKVHLYVGKHQRMTGEVKRLPKALAVIRRRQEDVMDAGGEGDNGDEGKGGAEELQIVEIVKYKILFSQRPEPVGGAGHEEL